MKTMMLFNVVSRARDVVIGWGGMGNSRLEKNNGSSRMKVFFWFPVVTPCLYSSGRTGPWFLHNKLDKAINEETTHTESKSDDEE